MITTQTLFFCLSFIHMSYANPEIGLHQFDVIFPNKGQFICLDSTAQPVGSCVISSENLNISKA